MIMKLYEKNWFIIVMLVVFFPVGLYLMWAKTNWSKAAKIIVTVAIAILGMIAFVTDDDTEETKPKQETSQTAHKTEEKAEDTKQHEKKETPKKDTVDQNKVSHRYQSDVERYVSKVGKSYQTTSKLDEQDTRGEMLKLIREAQGQFDKAQFTYDDLEPKTDKDKEAQKKVDRINALTDRAYMNAEQGLIDTDVDLINLATDDIEESGEIITDLQNDLESWD